MTFWGNNNSITNTANSTVYGPIPHASGGPGSVGYPGVGAQGSATNIYGTMAGSGGGVGTSITTSNYVTNTMNSITMLQPPNVISIKGLNNKDIVTIENDGTVTWAGDIDVDEAAEAFGRVLSLSTEMRSGITSGVKSRIRDSVFEDLISIAQDKGSLTAEDLTYLLRSSKIIENLKGI